MLSNDKLDPLSIAFSEALFAEFPAWEALAEIVEGDDTAECHMELTVRQSGTERALLLSTADHEITIGFDHWHTHLGPFLGLDTAGSAAQAMTIIRDFINELTVATVSFRDGAWIESGLSYRAAPKAFKPDTTTNVFSWHGTYDQTVVTP